MRQTIELSTSRREALIDITARVTEILQASGVRDGIVHIYAQGATAAIMIQENWDASVPSDVVDLLRKLIPPGIWLHDEQDGNGDAHLKAGLVGPSETVPIIDGKLGLSTWQGIFFCEFDGPRQRRTIVCTVLADPTA
ncbi:MAG: YjbQ family protein [Sterolibacteriaceae bacterium]|uniref:YjbQ family protein n=1 Tax=Candidatus Methylophosphatis roskildensis TaxID=2899263 RepID=A0A9D7E3S5_9PROT|nr:YjbQ family protein [Candidatus Methylophosphatis roskildensis]MBK7235129.1 YjbQ family protein [Sterolibacteriaceae bacterium]MBK7662819.1 YjbQ family protein [Sterolibacteriaceae bacterium]MBK9086929.1 YjbQ family protein [Sterolibacteriaceae bacterium]